MLVEVVTGMAAAVTHSSSFPQLLKSLRTRSTKDLSLIFMIQLLTGLSLWEIYGILKEDMIFIIGNSVGMSLWSSILAVKVVNILKGKEKKVGHQ